MRSSLNVKAFTEGTSLRVEIRDTGIGISGQSLSSLFQTYSQVSLSSAGEAEKGTRGTGLGLSIAKGIAEAHGGTVGAVSKEGAGSTFFFTIPIDA